MFRLDNPAVATVVPGIKNRADLEEAVACSDLPPLNPEDVVELQRLYRGGFAD